MRKNSKEMLHTKLAILKQLLDSIKKPSP
jgi:hypothetical protein